MDKGLLEKIRAAQAGQGNSATTEDPDNSGGGGLLSKIKAAEDDNVSRGTNSSSDLGQKIADVESNGGDYTATNPNSTATGKFQFLWGKDGNPDSGFHEDIKKVTGVKSREEFLNSPEAQEKFFQYHVENNLKPSVTNIKQYNRQGYSDDQLAMLVHFKGEEGAKEFLTQGIDRTKRNNLSIGKYIGPPEGKSMQPAATGVAPEIAHKDLQQANKTLDDLYFPDANNSTQPAATPRANGPVGKDFNPHSSNEWKARQLGTLLGGDPASVPPNTPPDGPKQPEDLGASLFGKDINGQPIIPLNKNQGNIVQAKQATADEINASKNYLGTFVKNNPEIQKYMSFGGLGSGQGDIDPENAMNRILNTGGDVEALSSFSGSALNLLSEKKKEDLAAIEKLHPLIAARTSPSATNDFDPGIQRVNEAGYNTAVAQLNQKYNDQEANLRNSIAGVANLKVANEYLQQHGTSKPITPKDAQEIGWQYMEAVGDGESARKQRQLYAQNLLSPAEKVEAQRVGYRVMQFKQRDAAASDQNAVADHLADAVANYPAKIRDANPEYIKENLINAISNQVNEDDKSNPFLKPLGRLGFSPSQDALDEAAKKLGISPADVKGISPSDLKSNRFGLTGEAVSGFVGSTAAPLYEFTMRHLVPGTNDDAVNKRFDQNWFDNSSVAHYVGGQTMPSDEIFQSGSKIDTDPKSESYLTQVGNPNAGKWNGDFSNVIGTVAKGLGGLAGFGEGIGAASSIAKGLGAAEKVANLAGVASYMYLTGYDNNKKQALAALGDKPENDSKANWLANAYTVADILGMEIVKPAKQLENIFGKTVLDGSGLIEKLAKGDVENLTKDELSKYFSSGLKKAGVNFTEMTGGMDAITLGRDFADMMLAPDKFKRENVGDDLLQSTVHASIINAIPALVGGFSMARHESPVIQDALYDVGSNPRPYIDAIDANVKAGKIDPNTAAAQKQTVNTLIKIVDNSVPETSPVNNQPLSDAQKKEYAANLYNEAVLAARKSNVSDKVQMSHIDNYVSELQKKREDILQNAGPDQTIAPEPAKGQPVQQQNNSGDIESFETSKGSLYNYGGDGKTKRFRTATGERNEPQDLTVFAKFDDPEQNQRYLAAVQKSEQSGTKVYVIDKDGNKINKNSETDGKDLQLALVDRDGKLLEAIPAVNKPQLGYNVFDQRRFNQDGQDMREKHLGNAVTKITYKPEAQPNAAKPPKLSKPTPVAEPAPDATQAEAENNISVGELMDKTVTFKGKEGTLLQDGQSVIVRMKDKTPEGREREYELGNIDEIKDHSVKDYGLEQKNTVVKTNDAGNVEVRGEEFFHKGENLLDAINTDKEGNHVVTLENSKGKKRTFRGSVGEDVAYHLMLKELDKNKEHEEFEKFINSDDESRSIIEDARDTESEPGGTSEPTEPAATEPTEPGKAPDDEGHGGASAQEPGKDTEPVPAPETTPGSEEQAGERKKLNRKEKAASIDLFSEENLKQEEERKKWLADHPEFDFEEEPTVVARKKGNDGIGLFSSQNKEEVSAQNQKAAAEWEAAKNKTVHGAGVPQAELADKFFNSTRTAPEAAESQKVGENVKNRFASSEKIVGNQRTRVLGDGSQMSGRYVLADANAITPSHDPTKGFKSSEGFPMLEDGRNPNDRDYTQKDVSGKVLQRANKYDGQAVENVPSVDKNGIVIDGNDRTMAGQLAAKNRTDKAYMEVLKANAENFGFTREQVEAMEKQGLHPRVIFMPDNISPYNTETFAKFNPRTQGKVKNSIENAITLGRTAPNELVDRLGGIMDGYETTAKFFGSPVAIKDVRALLERYKIVNADNANEFFDSPTSMTNNGKELLQNLMLGKTFGEDELRLLQNHRDVREKMIYSMNNILSIEALGDQYSLKGYFDEALHLWDEVERFRDSNGLKSMSQAFDLFTQQGNLHGETFSPEAQILFNELDSIKKSSLREFTRSFLASAKDYAISGADIFGNQPPEKQQLIKDYADLQQQRQREYELATKANAQRNEQSTTGEGERSVPVGTDGTPQAGEATPAGDGNENTAGQSQEPTDRIAEEYKNAENDLPLFNEPMPEYGKEDTTPPPTEPEIKESTDAVTQAYADFNKHNTNESKVAAKIERLEHDIAEMQRNRETSSDEYKQAVNDLEIQRKVKSQVALKKKAAELAIKKAEGRRMSDEIRKFKGRIVSDLAFSTPGISPNHFKAIIDFVAGAVKIGENVHDAILDAVIKFRDRNPDLKFDEDQLVSDVTDHIMKMAPENDKAYRPEIGSERNRIAADAIIGKIKSNPELKEKYMDDLTKHPSLSPQSKRLISNYIDYYTRNEDNIIRDSDNPTFLDDFKLKTSEETRKFVSGFTIEDIFGEKPAGNQDYQVMKQADMLADGRRVIDVARERFGGDVMQWGPKLLEAVKEMQSPDTPKKAIILATMQGRLREEMLNNPEREGQIRRVLDATTDYWQQFIRKSALDLVAAKILRVYRDQNLSEFFTDRILSEKQRQGRAEMERKFRDVKVSDKDAAEGPLRDQASVIEEMKAENERLKKELAEKPDGKKTSKAKREMWGKKSEEILKDDEVTGVLNEIKEALKKIKC